MQVTISIKRDNGQVIEISKELDNFDENNIIDRVEQQVLSIKADLLPLVSEKLIQQHQLEFKGKKNKEKERK